MSLKLYNLVFKKILNKFHLNYFLIGILNTFFGYFFTLIIYFLVFEDLGIVCVGIISHFFNVTFSFLTLKFLVFDSKGSWYFEYFRFHIAYLLMGFLSILTLYLFYEFFGFSIFISQFFAIMINITFAYFNNKYVIFKNDK